MKKAVVAVVALVPMSGLAEAEVIGPVPYLSFADSPFRTMGLSNFHLEDFEDGLANTPGLRYNGDVNAPLMTTDSVDGDDGAIDGFGRQGFSAMYGSFPELFEFTSLPLPTHVGFVITDVLGNPFQSPQGFTSVTVNLYDGQSNLVGTYGPFSMGDGQVLGQTAEDRFLGFIHPGGIKKITLTCTPDVLLELDHIQYGRPPIPAPGGLGLLCAALGLGGRRGRVR